MGEARLAVLVHGITAGALRGGDRIRAPRMREL